MNNHHRHHHHPSSGPESASSAGGPHAQPGHLSAEQRAFLAGRFGRQNPEEAHRHGQRQHRHSPQRATRPSAPDPPGATNSTSGGLPSQADRAASSTSPLRSTAPSSSSSSTWKQQPREPRRTHAARDPSAATAPPAGPPSGPRYSTAGAMFSGIPSFLSRLWWLLVLLLLVALVYKVERIGSSMAAAVASTSASVRWALSGMFPDVRHRAQDQQQQLAAAATPHGVIDFRFDLQLEGLRNVLSQAATVNNRLDAFPADRPSSSWAVGETAGSGGFESRVLADAMGKLERAMRDLTSRLGRADRYLAWFVASQQGLADAEEAGGEGRLPCSLWRWIPMQRLCRADRLAAASETLQAWLVDEMEVRSRLLESGEVNWEDVDKGIAHIKQGACWQWNWLAEYDASRNAKGGGGGSDGDGDGGVTTFALSLNRLGCSGAGLHRQLIGDLHAALNKDYAELQRLMALVAETKRCGEESLGCAPDELEKIVAGYRGFATRLYCKDH